MQAQNEKKQQNRPVNQLQQEFVALMSNEEGRGGFYEAFGVDVECLYTKLLLSSNGNRFTQVPLQIDTGSYCNTICREMYQKFGHECDMMMMMMIQSLI